MQQDIKDLSNILNYQFYNNTISDWLIAFFIFVISYYLLKFFKQRGLSILKEISEKTKNDVDDLIINIIEKFGWPFYFSLSLYISISFLSLPSIVYSISLALVWLFFLFYFVKTLDPITEFLLSKIEGVEKDIVDMIKTIAKAVVVIILTLVALSNMGFDITALIAGLGVGGIAVAFASQRIVEDIFSYFTIHLDKPFKVGDFIVISNDHKGTVEKIGIKSTRIRSLEGEELIIANKDLVNSRIKNYGRIKKRRAIVMFGVVYETPLEKLKKIPNIVEKIVSSKKLAEFDRCHFKSFGQSSLDYELSFYVNTKDYKEFLNILQEINLELLQTFKKEGIEFAYPTQLLYVKLDKEKQSRKRKTKT